MSAATLSKPPVADVKQKVFNPNPVELLTLKFEKANMVTKVHNVFGKCYRVNVHDPAKQNFIVESYFGELSENGEFKVW